MDFTFNRNTRQSRPLRSDNPDVTLSAPQRARSFDSLFREFWAAGHTHSITFLEQASLLMFARLLDAPTRVTGLPLAGVFRSDDDPRRWRRLVQQEPSEMLRIFRDEVIAQFRSAEGPFGAHLNDVQLVMSNEHLFGRAVRAVNAFAANGDDPMGDLYEHILGTASTARALGQFLTPRHIARFVVDLVEPRVGDAVADPACGTGRFLTAVTDHFLRKGLLTPESEPTLAPSRMFWGFDIDATMLRIAAMNMILRGVRDPNLHRQNTLATTFLEQYPVQGAFDVVLANPPFNGAIDLETLDPALAKPLSKRTEIVFLRRIFQMLKQGGRAAVIVPNGVLSNATNAHLSLRKELVQQNELEAVISLPASVFKPQAGVATSILVFAKGGTSRHVFFAAVEADGFSPDNKRAPGAPSDLPTTLARWKSRTPSRERDRSATHFMVPAAEIMAKNFDLSMGRYKAHRA